jgi:hypothetical protein
MTWRHMCSAYRAGAQAAVDALKHQWPEPITDRPPTEEDGDKLLCVQYLDEYGQWDIAMWESVAKDGDPWLHTPNWHTFKSTTKAKAKPLPEALKHALKMLDNGFKLQAPDLDDLRKAVEAYE